LEPIGLSEFARNIRVPYRWRMLRPLTVALAASIAACSVPPVALAPERVLKPELRVRADTSQLNYPPTPTKPLIPPLPTPDRVRGFHLVAEFDVDETGKVVDFKFTPTSDVGYNRRLEEMLKKYEFRPGTTRDGMPIRMKAQIVYDF
jgi:hypothetical protein